MVGAAVLAVAGAVLAAIQFSTPHLVGYDGYYHIKLAYLMRIEGLKPVFDWLPLTILNASEFVDHHFLFHMFLIPFTFGDLVLGAKLASVVFAVLAFLAVWWLLKHERVPHAWLWSLGLLAVSEAFLYRMSMARVQSLSLAVLALGLHFLLQRKLVALSALAGCYVWLFDGFPLIITLAGAYSLASWLAEGRFPWRPLAFASAGAAAGLVINPYFPQNLAFIYYHIFPKLFSPTTISVGSEWYPYDTGQLIQNSVASLVLLALAFLLVGLTGKAMSARVTVGMLLVLLFGAMLMQSRRFIEYFPAFVLIFAALASTDWLANSPIRAHRRKWMAGLALVALVISAWLNSAAAARVVQGSHDGARFAGAANWLLQNTARGERVFHTDWDDFPELFFHNHHNTYLVGLDPTYMQLFDQELYSTWVAVTRGSISQPAAVISGQFDSQYVFSDLGHQDFLSNASGDAAMQEVYRDDFAVVFHILAADSD